MSERLSGKVPYSDEDLKELMEENEVSSIEALEGLSDSIVDSKRLDSYRVDLRMRSSAGRNVAELAKELQQHPEIITGAGDADTVDGFVALLVHAFRALGDKEHRDALDSVCGAICEVAEFEREQSGGAVEVAASEHLGLRAIVGIYNMIEDRPLSRLAALTRAIELARGTSLLSPLVPLLARADVLASSWSTCSAVGPKDRRALILAAAGALQQDGRAAAAQALRLRCLADFQPALALSTPSSQASSGAGASSSSAAAAPEDPSSQEAREIAAAVARAALTSAMLFVRSSPLSFAAVRNLEGTDLGLLVRLLRVLRTGGLADLEGVVKEAGGEDALQGVAQVSVESLRSTLRVLLLSSLCHRTLGKPLGFAAVTRELGLSLSAGEGKESDEAGDAEEEAEEWVLEAVRQGLVEARVDEVEGTVRVTRATPRALGDSERESARRVLLAMHSAVGALEESAFAGTGREAAPTAAAAGPRKQKAGR